MEEQSDFSLDRMELTVACTAVRQNIRIQTLLMGLSEDDADALILLAVTMYIKARVRRR